MVASRPYLCPWPGRFRSIPTSLKLAGLLGRGDGQRRYTWGGRVLIGDWRGIVAGLVPRVCPTFVARAGRRDLALLIAGEGAVAPARIVITLQTEWVSDRNLCACRALERRQQATLLSGSPFKISSLGWKVSRRKHQLRLYHEKTPGGRSRSAYAKSGSRRF